MCACVHVRVRACARACSPQSAVFVCCRSPETATIKQKMLYSSSMQALKVALGDGIAHVIQAHDYGDLEWANVIAEISRLDRN